MLAIARALMSRPKLLLCDEPSQGLAPIIVEEMFTIIDSLSKEEGIAVLLSEQNLHFASAVSDRAVVIEKGAVRFTGTMDELAGNDAVRAAYLSV